MKLAAQLLPNSWAAPLLAGPTTQANAYVLACTHIILQLPPLDNVESHRHLVFMSVVHHLERQNNVEYSWVQNNAWVEEVSVCMQ